MNRVISQLILEMVCTFARRRKCGRVGVCVSGVKEGTEDKVIVKFQEHTLDTKEAVHVCMCVLPDLAIRIFSLDLVWALRRR